MNRDEAFEYQLAQWLEEGPFDAPSEPVAAALATIRAHPGRPRTLGSLWRLAMSGIGRTHLPSQPRPGWLPAAALVAGLAVVVVVGAYGLFNLGGQTGPGGGATPSPVVTPSPTPDPAVGTGRQTCSPSSGDVVTTVDDVIQTRGGVIECTNTGSDPRLSGESTITMDFDEHPDGLWLGWGTTEIRNADGTWSGKYAVTSTATATAMEFDTVLIGAGEYDGLEALLHVRVTSSSTTITSRVFEAGPVITGTETCSVVAAGTDFGTGDVTSSRGVRLYCSDTMADSRLSGQRTIAVSIDRRADDSADLWGTSTLANADGTWEGFFFGVVDPGYTTHHVRALMRGSGAYQGLFLRLEVVGTGEPGYQLTGEIIPAG